MKLSPSIQKRLLLLMVLFTGLNGYWLSELRFDFEVENLFPRHNPDRDFFKNHVQPFASDKSFVIVGIEQDKGIFQESFLTRLQALTAALDSLPLVKEASSLTKLKYPILTRLMQYRERPFIRVNRPDLYARDSAFLYQYADVREKFISSQDKGVCLYLELESNPSASEGKALLTKLHQQLQDCGFGRYHLAGSIETENTFRDALRVDLLHLSLISLAFILGVLWLIFRSFWGVLIPLLIILLTVWWTLGMLSAFGRSINPITVQIPTLIAIVALSDVVHIMTRFRESGKVDKKMAIQLALNDIGLAILLTSLTTALGFLTLTYSDIQPFVDFGLFTALGVGFAYLLAMLLLPILLVSLPDVGKASHTRSFWSFEQWGQRVFRFTQTRPRLIIGLSTGLLLLAGWGSSRLKVDALLFEEMSAGDTYSTSLNFFDQHFSGIRSLVIYVECLEREAKLVDSPALEKLEHLESYLWDHYGAKSVYSILTELKRFNRALYGGAPAYFSLPTDPNVFAPFRNILDSAYYGLGLRSILSPNYRSGLVEVKINDLGSYIIGQKNRALRVELDRIFPPSNFRTQISGQAFLLDKSNELITRKLAYGLLTAFAVVALIMGLLFRSVSMTLIALIPNVLPLLLVAGLMGWSGVNLKMSTAVIFTIAFGIAVDDTLHFLSRLKTEHARQVDFAAALERTFLSTGRAIVLTSIFLVMGFGILLFSAFTTTFLTGLFISMALLFAVFSDLILLPALLKVFGGRK